MTRRASCAPATRCWSTPKPAMPSNASPKPGGAWCWKRNGRQLRDIGGLSHQILGVTGTVGCRSYTGVVPGVLAAPAQGVLLWPTRLW